MSAASTPRRHSSSPIVPPRLPSNRALKVPAGTKTTASGSSAPSAKRSTASTTTGTTGSTGTASGMFRASPITRRDPSKPPVASPLVTSSSKTAGTTNGVRSNSPTTASRTGIAQNSSRTPRTIVSPGPRQPSPRRATDSTPVTVRPRENIPPIQIFKVASTSRTPLGVSSSPQRQTAGDFELRKRKMDSLVAQTKALSQRSAALTKKDGTERLVAAPPVNALRRDPETSVPFPHRTASPLRNASQRAAVGGVVTIGAGARSPSPAGKKLFPSQAGTEDTARKGKGGTGVSHDHFTGSTPAWDTTTHPKDASAESSSATRRHVSPMRFQSPTSLMGPPRSPTTKSVIPGASGEEKIHAKRPVPEVGGSLTNNCSVGTPRRVSSSSASPPPRGVARSSSAERFRSTKDLLDQPLDLPKALRPGYRGSPRTGVPHNSYHYRSDILNLEDKDPHKQQASHDHGVGTRRSHSADRVGTSDPNDIWRNRGRPTSTSSPSRGGGGEAESEKSHGKRIIYRPPSPTMDLFRKRTSSPTTRSSTDNSLANPSPSRADQSPALKGRLRVPSPDTTTLLFWGGKCQSSETSVPRSGKQRMPSPDTRTLLSWAA